MMTRRTTKPRVEMKSHAPTNKREANLRPRLVRIKGAYIPGSAVHQRMPLGLVLSRSRHGVTRVLIARASGHVETQSHVTENIHGLSDSQLMAIPPAHLEHCMELFVRAGALRKAERRDILLHRRRVFAHAMAQRERYAPGRPEKEWHGIGAGAGPLHEAIIENARIFGQRVDPEFHAETTKPMGRVIYTTPGGYEHG